MRFTTCFFIASLSLASCRSTAPMVVDADPEQREVLFETISALEGRWEGSAPPGMQLVSEFEVIAEGTAVRETMFPGTSHEMTNMYTLDGNTLVMTHYCAGGTQPHMRAAAVEANALVFSPDGVSDLKETDESYMGAMTLIVKDSDTIEQHWKSMKMGELVDGAETIFSLKRIE